ncbi:MAG TPA: hypothetical protein VEY91_02180 [Candidatus Limnocylindria bacterium]|nr:hypothetical protein [Candidatus Limnocylindria bacterium]
MRFALVASLALLFASNALAAPTPVDSGTFIVSQGERRLGTEVFVVQGRGDSLLMTSLVEHTVPTPDGDVPLEKSSFLVASLFDFGLRRYDSHQIFRNRRLSRSVQVAETTLTIYRELDKAGNADVIAAPPGRLFIIDPMMFSLFDLMCLSLHERTFETRPLSVLVLGPSDSLLQARVTDLGTETIRWGERTIQARKLQIGDDQTSFFAWVDPKGAMLRLHQPQQDLRVERRPPAVKKRAPRPAKPPGG